MDLHVLENDRGIQVELSPYGGRIVSVRVPDRDGRFADVTLGYDSLSAYRSDDAFLGALVGRFANRIARGRFTLDGRTHQLPVNDPPNHLHGGPGGFHAVRWAVEPTKVAGADAVALSYRSPAGEEGYPGTVDVRATVTLSDADELTFDYHATTDAATPLNLSQHSYWNLRGHAGADDVLDHVLTVAGDRFLPVDETMIPTGELRAVEGTPFDFRQSARIGDRIGAADRQLERARGYDHTWVLGGAAADGEATPSFAARLEDPHSGRALDVLTTEPGIQVYTGNWLDDVAGKGGHRYGPHAGVALETQHFPDSPNRPDFPSTVLRPGDEYRSRTIYRFSVR